MSLSGRDQEAYDLARGRTYKSSCLVSLDVEMQARRLTLQIYGSLRARDPGTFRATLTFFGTSALSLANESGAFPESVRIDSLELSYDDSEDEGLAVLSGEQGWTLRWNFDGVAYEDSPCVLASLADDS